MAVGAAISVPGTEPSVVDHRIEHGDGSRVFRIDGT